MKRSLLDVVKALALAAVFFFVVQAVLQNYQVLGRVWSQTCIPAST